MSLFSVVTAIERIDTRQIQKTILESAVVKQAVIDRAREVQDYWKSNEAPVSNREAHPLQKGSVQWDHPEDYRNSIKVKYSTAHAPFSATVFTLDPKAHWLEYGSIHNSEFGFAGRVVEHFNASAGGVVMGRSMRSSDEGG
jgi:hypothetical protein